MSLQFPGITVQKRLQVGIGKPEALGVGEELVRGSTYIQGPVLLGDPGHFPNVEGTLMVGPMKNEDCTAPELKSGETFLDKWNVTACGYPGRGAEKGAELFDGYTAVIRAPEGSSHEVKSGTPAKSAAFFYGDVDIIGHLRIADPKIKSSLTVDTNASFGEDVVVKKALVTGKNVMCGADITAQGEIMSKCGAHILSAKKNFDIPHPSREGWRLRHTCPEGPTNDIYLRGKVKNKTYIEIPYYWKDLVDIESITVSLTPIGAHQDVIVKRIEEDKIHLQARGGMPINCFYHVFGERTDGEKLISEYKGLTPEDYPGDNSEYNINT
jgi:hypothetical protein